LADTKETPPPLLVLTFEREKFNVLAETIPITDAHLRPVWGDKIARIVFRLSGQALRGHYKICLEKQTMKTN